MKYLLILAVLAGSYYQFYFPKFNEESIEEFVAEIRLAETNKDYDAMSKQLAESVLISKLDKDLNVINKKEMTNNKLMKFVKQINKPKFDMIEKSETEKIEIFDDKALVTSLNTHWITVNERRIKKISRGVVTIIIQRGSFKVSEMGSFDIKTRNWSTAGN